MNAVTAHPAIAAGAAASSGPTTAPTTDDPILDIDGAWAELKRQGLHWTRRQVQRQAVEFRDREGGLPFRKLPNGQLAIRRSALLKAIAL